MTAIESAAQRALEAVAGEGFRCALVGGLAVSIRAEPRTTRDVDCAVAVASDDEAERLIHALGRRGYRPFEVVEESATRRLAIAKLAPDDPRSGAVSVDLLFAASGIEPEIVSAAERVAIAKGVELPVARRGHLLALKVLARDERRPQDELDIRALLRAATPADVALARDALALVAARA